MIFRNKKIINSAPPTLNTMTMQHIMKQLKLCDNGLTLKKQDCFNVFSIAAKISHVSDLTLAVYFAGNDHPLWH